MLAILTLVPIAVVASLAAGAVAWVWLALDVQVDVIRSRHPSPDGRREVAFVWCDHGFGLGMSEQYGEIRMRRAKGWGLGKWQPVLRFDENALDRLERPPVWTDDRHLVVTFAPEAYVSPDRKTVLGVDVEFRRSPQGAVP